MEKNDMNNKSSAIRRGVSLSMNAEEAAKDLAFQLDADSLNAMVFFCDPSYDLEILGSAICRYFNCPVVGCTTAGEIVSPDGYIKNSLTGVGFASGEINLTPIFIPSLKAYVNDPDLLRLTLPSPDSGRKQFALLFVDGLSMLEERVTSFVNRQLSGIPLIGGSAGDGLNFGKTFVYYKGEFHQNAAVLSIFSTSFPFKTFQFQHFLPSEIKLVITEADVSIRTVFEINGVTAADEYARLVKREISELSPSIFAAHPLLLKIGGSYYVRSIQRVNQDGSLTFYCAIEKGLVLTLGESDELCKHLGNKLAGIANELPGLQLILGGDCILRRLEIEQNNNSLELADILSLYPFVGFNTYGEQFGGIHVNQTLTGVAIGGAGEE